MLNPRLCWIDEKFHGENEEHRHFFWNTSTKVLIEEACSPNGAATTARFDEVFIFTSKDTVCARRSKDRQSVERINHKEIGG